MLPVLLEIRGVAIQSFGLMLSLAFLAGGLVMHADFRRKQVPAELAWWIVLCGLVGGLVGARIHLAFQHPEAFAADPVGFVASGSGLVWYGGLLGGVLATGWPIRRYRVRWLSAADSAAPALAVGLAIGRIGCHLAGDGDWGTPTQLPWGVAYVNAVAGWPHPAGVRVHPAALYELLALLAIAGALWRARSRVARDGEIFMRYLALAAAARFAIEFVRTARPLALGLSEAQWTSALLATLACVWLASTDQRRRSPGRARG